MNIFRKTAAGISAAASALALALSAASCTSQSLETVFTSQNTRIDSYIERMTLTGYDEEGNEITVKPEVVTRNGCHRVIINNGDGAETTAGSTVSIEYAGYVFASAPTVLFGTNKKEIAEAAGWSTEGDFAPLTVKMNDKNLVEGLRHGLIGAKKGEECFVFFSGKYGMGKTPLGLIPSNSALCYRIWVTDVRN